MITRRTLLAGGAGSPLCAGAQAVDAFAEDRERLVAQVERDLADIGSMTGRATLDPRVLDALRKVPRHRFMPMSVVHRAYENRALPIGHEQTISQPSVVALMTDLLDTRPGDRVLEIGTGSGYQTAVLAELVERVYTIEIVRPLGERAAVLLKALGYDNIEARIGDGHRGWPEAARFDAIIVTAAPEQMPQPLIDQLARGGQLIAPVGSQADGQELLLMRKGDDGQTVTRNVLAVRFVPLTRER
ncbi:MAG: protein-L-isoaspartate(D-aspartate) O-methyltransferase [Methylibium sp.]|nr:protein-L-isoaspartate(D-aspartate) O-methyltransferase [Methylibium sp.]